MAFRLQEVLLLKLPVCLIDPIYYSCLLFTGTNEYICSFYLHAIYETGQYARIAYCLQRQQERKGQDLRSRAVRADRVLPATTTRIERSRDSGEAKLINSGYHATLQRKRAAEWRHTSREGRHSSRPPADHVLFPPTPCSTDKMFMAVGERKDVLENKRPTALPTRGRPSTLPPIARLGKKPLSVRRDRWEGEGFEKAIGRPPSPGGDGGTTLHPCFN